MDRKTFLVLAAGVGGLVGLFALAAPDLLLKTKGIESAAAAVWVREVGVLLLATAGCAAFARNHRASPTLVVLLWANAFIQLGLLAVEVGAFANGTLPLLAGILPNCGAHIVLAVGFSWYAVRMRTEEGTSSN